MSSMSSRVRMRVLRSPIWVTRPRVRSSMTRKSPMLYGASATMKTPANRLASESLLAKPTARPTTPALAIQALTSMFQASISR